MSAVREARSPDGAHSRDVTTSSTPLSVRVAAWGPPSGSVLRGGLLERLIGHPAVPLVAVVAQAGSGKTTLLQQWAARDPRPFAWLRLTARDNDPSVLLSALALAIGRIAPVDADVLGSFAAPGLSFAEATARILSVLEGASGPGVLVLDDAHRLDDTDGHDVVVGLLENLPRDWQIVIAGREELWLPIARMRAEGRLGEIGADDLAMDDDEASELLAEAGVTLDRGDVEALNQRAEGWPVALYLAALALASGHRVGRKAEWHGGNDRLMADYLTSEVLAALPTTTVEFLTRTALPERLCGPLCDALLDADSSAERLVTLERENTLIVSLDDERVWYRYRQVFREWLIRELHRREPDHVVVLRQRAADWYEANGLPELAIDEAMTLDDESRVARIATEHALPFYQAGREATMGRWFEWLDGRDLLDRYPHLVVTGALMHVIAGRAVRAARWIDAVERSIARLDRPSAQDPETSGELSMLRAAACSHDLGRMRQDASDAVWSLPVGSPWRAASLVLLGTACLVMDEREEAARILWEAVEVADDGGNSIAASVALAQLALLSERSGRLEDRDDLADRARAVVADHGLDDYATSALVFAINGRIHVDRGDARRAKTLLARAQRLRPHLTRALPVIAVQARLELARAYVSITDVSGARTVLREATGIVQWMTDPTELVDEISRLQRSLETLRVDIVGATSLTSAELRLLPLLATHLSFRKIGERLFISQNTVKTEAISIYRKFGVSSRGDAIERAQALGLLEERTRT